MRSKITILSFLIGVLVFSSSISNATVTYTVGATGNYTTINAAFNACNTSTDYVIEIKSDYTTETLPIVLNETNNTYRSATNTVTIRPQSGVASLALSQTAASNLFDITAAEYVIIDGRAGGTGNSVLTLKNSNTAAGSRVFYFEKGANHNTVQYCTIQGSNQNTTLSDITKAGIIYFDGSSTANLTNNTFDNCTIGDCSGNRPAYVFVSYCTSSGKYNDLNTISNCNIFNFSSCAVELEQYNNRSWTISGNNFYQGASITPTTAFSFIDLNTDGTSGNTTTVTGNYFGGQATSCGGSAFTLGSSSYEIRIISFKGSNTTNNISNNTIANLNISTTGKYYGIAFGDIITTLTNGATISGNSFHDINLSNTTTTGIQYMIMSNTSGNAIINSNVIGSENTNNMVCAGNCSVNGIYIDGDGVVTDSSNTIQQFNLTNAGTSSAFTAIYEWSGKMDAANNTIQNIASASTATFPIIGIKVHGTGLNQLFVGNTLQNFAGTSTSNITSYIYGIMIGTSDSTGSGTISKNRILNFTLKTTSGSGSLTGVYTSSTKGAWNYYNNVIILDNSTNTNPLRVLGLYFSSTTGAMTAYHNTIKISGSVASGTTTSAAMYDYSTTGSSRTVKNNIFQNLRTGTAIGHYAVYVTNTSGATYDYNYDEVADDQSKICKWGSTNETFANWQTAASASHDKNGTITITTNGVVNSSTSSTIANDGTNLLTIVPDDILGNPRTTTPWLGAYEVDSLMLGINNVLASTYYFTIFPSPTNYNNINIAFNNFNESSIVKVELLNITGETICAEEISNNKNIKLNVSSKISSGIYFIKITNKDKVSVKKLVIN